MAQPTLARISHKLRSLSAATASCAAIAIAASTPAAAEKGIANYASYLDRGYALEAAATLERRLASKVLIQQVRVGEQTYLRLQSQAMDSIQAKSLVVRATATGLDAWYQGAASANGSVSEATLEAETVRPATVGVVNQSPEGPVNSAPTMTVPIPAPVQLTSANPELAAMLPEGPLLGELYPPRSPVSGN